MRNLILILAFAGLVSACVETADCGVHELRSTISPCENFAAIYAFQNRSFDGIGTYTTGDGDPNN